MPLFTFYYFHGTVKTPVPRVTWNHWPSDYGELKDKLEEVALTLYEEHKMTSAIIVLERHKGGKFHWGSKGYKRTYVRHKRSKEAWFKTSYSPTTGKVTWEQFNPSTSTIFMLQDFLELEKGKKYKATPIIPKMHQGLLGRDFMRFHGEMSGLRLTDYSRTPHLNYAVQEDLLHIRQHYQARVPRGYLEGGERVSEQIKNG